MAWAFNSLTAPVTNTASLITFNMVDSLGAAVTSPGAMQVRINGTGMSYNATTGVMTGTVLSVELFNSTSSTVLQTVNVLGADQTGLAAKVTAFLSHAITFQTQLTTWAAPAFNNYGTAVDTGATPGEQITVPLLNGTTIVGYLKVNGNQVFANQSEAIGEVYNVELLTAGGVSYVPAKTVNYDGPGYNTAGNEFLMNELFYGGKGNWEMLYGVLTSGDNTLSVNAANTFVLDAGIGNDTITGGTANDTVDYKYATGGVNVDLSRASDHATFEDERTLVGYTQQLNSIENLNGSRFSDTLRGSSGANILYGGADSEVDALHGGLGNDTFIINDTFDTVADVGGTDTIRATININLTSYGSVENLEMVGSQISGTGNSLANSITGNSQANIINGMLGADTMTGGALNDTYYVDNAGDSIIETAGQGTADEVRASATFALAAGSEVEILKTTSIAGTGAMNLTGSAIANTITGNNGANRLDGGADALTDILNGQLGDDVYVLGSGSDTVNDTGGIDTIESSITRTLASYAAIEKLTLTGTSAANATGNALDNTLTGNTAANTLTGGAGKDKMTGGAGNDTFVFEANGADTITDFGAKYFTLTMNAAGVVTPSASTATASGAAVMNLGNTRLQLDITSTGLNWGSTATGNKVTGFGYYQGGPTVNGTLRHDILIDTGSDKLINSTTGKVTSIWKTANDQSGNTLASLASNILANGHYLEIDTTDHNTPGAIRGQLTAVAGSTDVISVAGLNISEFATIQELAFNSGTSVVIKRNANTVANTLTLENTQEAQLLTTHFAFATGTANDSVTGTAGADDLFGGLGNDTLTGSAGSDRLFGEAGNDLLDGGTGNDRMFGGAGSDIYVVDSLGDFISDSAGLDTIRTSTNYSLNTTALAAIEWLETTNSAGTTNLMLTGNAAANQITGNAGNNIIDGKTGVDTMIGGAGNDTFFVDNASDVITESTGTDTVKASITYALGAGVSIETLTTATSTGNINLTGNELAQKVLGNNGANTISGGAGLDTLTGSGGNDNFLFDTALNATTNRDTITDYNTLADTIRLENTGTDLFNALGTGTLSASRFVVGSAALDTADRIIYNKTTGAVFYDADGSGAGAAIQFATIQNKATLTNLDFVIV